MADILHMILILMRIADVQLALPFILMALTFTAIVGPGLFILITLMIVLQWVQYARLVRGMVLSLRDREFIESARAIGPGDRCGQIAHSFPASAAKCFGADHRAYDAKHCKQYPSRKQPDVRWPRGRRLSAQLGRHVGGRAKLHPDRLVDQRLPRPWHHDDGAGHESVG